MVELTYLASPYSSPDPAVREQRYRDVVAAVARLMQRGEHVFSPIASSHPIAVAHDLPGDWAYWAAFDELMVSRCDRLVVLMLDGWRTSRGVHAEIAIAQRLGIPVTFMEPVMELVDAQ